MGSANKHKRGRLRRGQRSARRPRIAARPLNAAHQATLTREARTRSERRQAAPTMGAISPIAAGLGLVNHRAAACLELPKRLMTCRSPFELWREQARFMQEGFADYARYAASLFPNIRNGSEVTNGR